MGLVFVVHYVLARIMGRPVEWYRAATFGVGFAIAYWINDYFQITGLMKYVVLLAIALPAFYVGQYLEARKRPVA